MILVVFHTAGINEKKKDIYHEKNNNNKIFDAVGWKSYCSRLWSWAQGAGRWATRRVRAGRAGRARQTSVSGRAGAGGRAGAHGVQAGTAWACADGLAGPDRQGTGARGRAVGKAWTRGGARQALARAAGERAAGRGKQARGP